MCPVLPCGIVSTPSRLSFVQQNLGRLGSGLFRLRVGTSPEFTQLFNLHYYRRPRRFQGGALPLSYRGKFLNIDYTKFFISSILPPRQSRRRVGSPTSLFYIYKICASGESEFFASPRGIEPRFAPYLPAMPAPSVGIEPTSRA